MQITCASCKSVYNLTANQVQGLSSSILPCTKCSRFIKITACPYCNSHYSITFSSATQSNYQLTCERCSRPFIIDFPLIKEAEKTADYKLEKKAGPGTSIFFKNIFVKNKKRPPIHEEKERRTTVDFSDDRRTGQSTQPVSVSLGNLFVICSSAFTPLKILTAAVTIIFSFILLFLYGRMINEIFSPGDAAAGDYIKSFLAIIPFSLIFFIYIIGAAIIARITLDDIEAAPGPGAHHALRFIAQSIVPVFVSNVILFLAADMVLVLFGRIPVIGPVLFAIMFLPVYVISLCIFVLLAIGFWFYPPVIAGSPPGAVTPIRGLVRFIREQNFKLAYTIPLMAMITAVTFAAIYLLHYGSFSLTLYLAKNVLAEEGDKIFSAIPSVLLQLSDFTVVGSDSGLFKSLMSGLLWSHTIGGIIIGGVLSLISIFLFASFISITATLSTRFYVMMEKGTDMDDTSKIRILLFLVLMLAGIFLLKKIFF
jgi:hypothetical protein